MLAGRLIGRIDRLHTSIKTQDEIVEIQADAKSVSYRYLLPKVVQTELSTGLLLVGAESPYIAAIKERRPIDLPCSDQASGRLSDG